MEDFKVSNYGTRQMFENPVLERLTRTHFLTPIIMFSFVSIVSVGYGLLTQQVTWYHAIWLYLTGIVFFTFIEYAIHRWLFHLSTETEGRKKFQYNVHGVHHEFPKDKDRLVMPPPLSIGLSAIFYFIFRFTMGPWHWAFFAGFLEGYCIYLFIHYAVHRFRTPKNFLGYLWKHHSIHHYGKCDMAYGVSNPLWDYLFGTMPKTKALRDKASGLPDNFNL